MAEPGAAPAVVARNHGSGRPRVTVRPYYGGLPLMAGRGPDEGRRKLPGSRRAEGPPSGPGSTVPRTEKPRWSAERRARRSQDARRASQARNCL